MNEYTCEFKYKVWVDKNYLWHCDGPDGYHATVADTEEKAVFEYLKGAIWRRYS